jgi:hypothetical protein
MKGRIPHLPNVTSLTVEIYVSELHSFGDGLSDILAQCNNLKYLCLDLHYCCLISDFVSNFFLANLIQPLLIRIY